MNTRENTLRAIRLEEPDFVPVFDGTVWEAFELGGNFAWNSFTDHWGVEWRADLAGYAPVDIWHPLADLSRIDTYAWPDPHALTWTTEDQCCLDAVDRSRKLIGGLQINFLFERLRSLLGMENLLTSFYEDPDRLQVVIDRIADYQTVCLQRFIDLGVDIIHVPDDLGSSHGLLLSPHMIRQFLMPVYERLFAPLRACGVMIDFHCDGMIEPIIDDLINLGISVLNPLEIQANDQACVRAQVKGRVAVLGGIDSRIVHTGTVDEVCREVERAFALWESDRGWLAAPDQVITGAPEENIKALWETCWELAGM